MRKYRYLLERALDDRVGRSVTAPAPYPDRSNRCWAHGGELPCVECVRVRTAEQMKESVERAIIGALGEDPSADVRRVW